MCRARRIRIPYQLRAKIKRSCYERFWPRKTAQTICWKSWAASLAATQKQRASELNQWRNAHPALASACREAAEALTRVQIEYLERMTDEINDTSDDMVEGEFLLNEFVDRYGPRLAHLNGVIQVLAQLSSVPNPANSQHG